MKKKFLASQILHTFHFLYPDPLSILFPSTHTYVQIDYRTQWLVKKNIHKYIYAPSTPTLIINHKQNFFSTFADIPYQKRLKMHFLEYQCSVHLFFR